MITTIIIDDEINGAEVLKLLLEQNCPQIHIVAIEYDPDKGINAINALKPDLVFLDIEMPSATGFDVIEATKHNNYIVIFTTAYEHYAIKALKAKALDYLLKPIDLDELLASVEEVEKSINAAPNFNSKNIEDALTSIVNQNKKISFATNEGIIVSSPDDIIYLESESNYTNVFFKDGRKLLVSKTLKSIEEQFAGFNYCRVHSAFLVNLNELERYIKGDGGTLILKNKTSIPVSRVNKQELMNKLGI
jgi:two-component system, LytTR family, response regulator